MVTLSTAVLKVLCGTMKLPKTNVPYILFLTDPEKYWFNKPSTGRCIDHADQCNVICFFLPLDKFKMLINVD